METKLKRMNFKYWETDWYKRIYAENIKYKYELIKYLLLFSFFALLLFLVLDLITDKGDSLSRFLFVIAINVVLYITFVKTKRVEFFGSIVISLLVAAFFVSLIIPKNYNISLIITFAFPIIVFHIKGIKNGFKYILIYGSIYLFAGFLYFGNKSNLINFNQANIYSEIIYSVAFILITFLAYRSKKSYNKTHFRNIKSLIVDDTTGLPNKGVLVKSFFEKTNYMLCILSIDNFANLTRLFGYDIVEKVISFSCLEIVSLEKEYDFNTYKLMSNEFGLLFKIEYHEDTAYYEKTLNNLWKELSKREMLWNGSKIHICYRIGAAFHNVDKVIKEGNDNLLSKADIALKEAEKNHRNVVIYDDGIHNKDGSLVKSVKIKN